MSRVKSAFFAFLFLLASSSLAVAGQLSLGAEFVGWNSNYLAPANYSGWELWAPLSMNFKLDPGVSVYGQTEFGNGNYTDSLNGTETIRLTNFSDTVLGTELKFTSFSLPSILNVGFNIPTGDPTWEAKQINASIPTEFVDSRYRGRGFGISALYGLSFPAGTGEEFGAATGYMYAGAFNPSYGIGVPASQLKLGDSLFFSLNHVQSHPGNQAEIIRLSSFLFLPTQNSGTNIFTMGPNFNASYSLVNPKDLSFELGVQYYLPAQRPDANGNLTTEPHTFFAPRFYLTPSYAFGDIALTARFKYVLANGYPASAALYDGGGFLAGIEPAWIMKLDDSSALKWTASYDYVAFLNGGYDANSNRTNVIYGLWTFGTSYEVKL